MRFGLPTFFAEWFERWELNNDFKAIYTLLRNLSREIDISDLVSYVSRYPGLEALNHNVDSTGIIILPRFPAINQPIESVEIITHDNGLSPEKEPFSWADTGNHLQMKSLYYTEPKFLSTRSGRKIKIENYIIERGSPRTCLDKLIVAVCPISRGTFLRTKLENSPDPITGYVFEITGLNRKNYIRSRIKAAYLAACQSRADILMFPEMLGEEATFQRDFWDSLCDLADDAGYKKKPWLILTPTWWHNYTNELRVYNEGNECLFEQQKQFPFDYGILKHGKKVQAAEDIRNPNSVIHILHVNGIGRLMIPICKDFLIEEYQDIMLRELQATVLLIPSFSFGSTRFNLEMSRAIPYGCYEIWLNTCSALWSNGKPPRFIGIVSSPFLTQDGTPSIHPMLPQCNGYCGSDNDACMFLATIDLDENRAIHCEHVADPNYDYLELAKK